MLKASRSSQATSAGVKFLLNSVGRALLRLVGGPDTAALRGQGQDAAHDAHFPELKLALLPALVKFAIHDFALIRRRNGPDRTCL